MTYPTLRSGARGEHVVLLQSALNCWAASPLPPLVADGTFGLKTSARVRAFQLAFKLFADGVVGAATWSALAPLVAQVLGGVTPVAPPVAPPSGQSPIELGLVIVKEAEQALARWGWQSGTQPSESNERIAAALCANSNNPRRPRQGARGLTTIFAEAGASSFGRNIPSISAEAVRKWQAPNAGVWRNQNDLCAWCGIFCIYVYRVANVYVPNGWAGHSANASVGNSTVFQHLKAYESIFPGCIGVVGGMGGRNHHFIVTSNANGTMTSIDGNAFGNAFNQGNKSTIHPNSYSYANLKNEGAYFLGPVRSA